MHAANLSPKAGQALEPEQALLIRNYCSDIVRSEDPPHRFSTLLHTDISLMDKTVDIPNAARYILFMSNKELIGATSATITLSILCHADSYGYEMIHRVTELTNGELVWTEAMLYPVLHRLESRDFVKSYWQTSPSGRKRKYYSITQSGLADLENRQRQWRIVCALLAKLWSDTV